MTDLRRRSLARTCLVVVSVLVVLATTSFSSASTTPRGPGFGDFTGSHTITYDGDGSPVQVTLKLTGPPSSSGYKLCIAIDDSTRPSYNDYDYGTQCRTFDFAAGTTSSQTWGTTFPWGGPANYVVTWYVPPNGDVAATDTFKWADKSGNFSPCPPDPKLQAGIWEPSRLHIVHRCMTWQSTVTKNYAGQMDGDRDWYIKYGSGSRKVEYMIRDDGRLRGTCAVDCSMPTVGQTWKITGSYICDTHHGDYEFHAVFLAQQIVNGVVTRSLLSGPQYSTQVWGGPYPNPGTVSCP